MKVWSAILVICFSLICSAQTNNIVPPPSSQMVSNIILMTEHKVSDQVILAYIQSQKETNQSVKIIQKPAAKQIDVEGYDFFYWNYLYPRTLRYRYQMFYPYEKGIYPR